MTVDDQFRFTEPIVSWQFSRDRKLFLVTRREALPTGPGTDSDVEFVDQDSVGDTRDYWRTQKYDLAAESFSRATDRGWSDQQLGSSIAGRRYSGRNADWKTELFGVDLASGSTQKITNPQWSQDFKPILVSAVSLNRWQVRNGDLWLLDVETGRIRDLTPNHTGRFVQPVFSSDGRSVYGPSGYGTTRFPSRSMSHRELSRQSLFTIFDSRFGLLALYLRAFA